MFEVQLSTGKGAHVHRVASICIISAHIRLVALLISKIHSVIEIFATLSLDAGLIILNLKLKSGIRVQRQRLRRIIVFGKIMDYFDWNEENGKQGYHEVSKMNNRSAILDEELS